VQQAWLPKSELERTVYAALVLAGEPVNNLKLATLMGVSPGESSRRVAQLEHVIKKRRQGQVMISLN
jgi:chromosome segregation and condensation protein ScpB